MNKFIPPIREDDRGFEIENIEDLLCKKELISSKIPDNIKVTDNGPEPIVSYPYYVDIDALSKQHLSLQSYQLFVRNFFNIYTPYDFLHLYFTTGAGKTLASLSIAHEFVRKFEIIYQKKLSAYPTGNYYIDYVKRNTPNVIIIGTAATENEFKKELISRPEFGLVTSEEYLELQRKVKLASDTNDPDHDHAAKLERSRLLKRLKDKDYGGFYKFYSFDKLPGKFFMSTTENIIDLFKVAESNSNFDIIDDKIKRGEIKINYQFVREFYDSLLIIDEFHSLYNMDGLNRRGYVLKYLIDMVRTKSRGLRIVALTATPFSSSAVESVYYVNFMVRKENRVNEKDLFDSDGKPKKGTIEKIGALTNGKVAYLQDNTMLNFPKRTIVGEPVLVDGVELPYLKFIKCQASELHERKIKEIGSLKVQIQATNIFNMVFPHPQNLDDAIYESEDITKYYLHNRESQILRDLGVNISHGKISGEWLKRDNLKKYSQKYVRMLDLLRENLANKTGKVILYNQKVKDSGVKLIEEILKENGFVLYGTSPEKHSICFYCQHRYDEHKKQDHSFKTTTFVTCYAATKDDIYKYVNIYNDSNNLDGSQLFIILGTNVILESITFKAVRQLIVTSPPKNISGLLQLFGRAVRNKSHEMLPPEKREVFIYILITTLSSGTSIEEEYYRNLLERYRDIQLIEREIIKYAIEGDIHRNIIMTKNKLAEYFENSDTPIDTLGMLYYEPYYTTTSCKTPSLLTFTAHGHHKKEVNLLIYMLKRLFYTQPVWSYDDLWKAVQNPPFKMNSNPQLFSEGNFTIALTAILFDEKDKRIIMDREKEDTNIQFEINKLYDVGDRYIYKHGRRHIVKQIGDKYILFPLLPNHNVPNSDVETYLRPPLVEKTLRINLKETLKNVTDTKIFRTNLKKLVENYSDENVRLINIFTEFDSEFHKSLIKYYVEHNDKRIKHVIKLYDDLDLLIKDKGKIVGYKDNKLNVIYKEDQWITIPATMQKWEENDIVIGYYEFVSKPQFKLRSPNIDKSVLDKRKIEKGSVCTSKLKIFLMKLVERLGIKTRINRRHSLCDAIELELINREIKERQKKSNIKYIYIW